MSDFRSAVAQMTSSTFSPKILLVYGVIIPLALLLGYLLASPTDFTSYAFVGLVFGVLCIPILLKWHQPILIFSWNASIAFYFLPGEPRLWMLMAISSLGIIILDSLLNKKIKFVHVPEVTWTLFFFLGIVMVTGMARGGIGVRAFGSESYGGKGYFLIIAAAIGYFALSGKAIPQGKQHRYILLFFIATLTSAISNLAYTAGKYFGEGFWILFNFFPSDYALSQASADFGLSSFSRFGGVALAMVGIYSWMMARYGIRGIFSTQHPFRLFFWCLTIIITFLGGFRSLLVIYFVAFWVLFYLEGLFRSQLFITFMLASVLTLALLIPFASHLPLPIQRTLSLIPVIQVDPVARMDAFASTDWRVRMWKAALPDVPKYFWLGKGFVINPTDLYMNEEGRRRGFVEDFEGALLAGDYHNGPLSLLIPLGIFGTLAFIAFTIACVRVMRKNYIYSDPHLKKINRFLLALFIARLFSFWVIFGAVSSSLATFTGLIGISVALNRGVRKAPPAKQPMLPIDNQPAQ